MNREMEQLGLLQSLEARAQAILQERRHLVGAMLGILGIIQADALVLIERDESKEAVVVDVGCDVLACATALDEIYTAGEQRLPEPVASETPSIEAPTTTMPATTTTSTTTTIAQPPPPEIQAASNEVVALPLNPETEISIEAMQLSVQGYRDFLQGIDTSLIEYARQYPEFDPSRNGFRQDRRIEWVTIHHTAYWANAGTTDHSQPVGEPDPKVLIDMMAKRGDEINDHMCCAVQFFNDRNGKMWQFTSRTTRVRHDKRLEEISIGLETEGIDEQFTTKQFENIVYWSIATTNAEALLRGGQLDRIIRGHEEVRDEYNNNHPEDKQSSKQDGDRPIMQRIRQETADFLAQNPEVIDIAVTIQ